MASNFHPAVVARGCSVGPEPGTQHLEAAIIAAYGRLGAFSAGIFNCRRIGGTLSWSVHAEGRALDVMVGSGGVELGDQLLDALLQSAWPLGLQRIIWNRRQWDADQPAGDVYHGDETHEDHLHIEQEPVIARTLSRTAAGALVPGSRPVEGVIMGLLVTIGQSIWVVSLDLSSRTGLHASADVTSLLATGLYRTATLSEGTIAGIPIAG